MSVADDFIFSIGSQEGVYACGAAICCSSADLPPGLSPAPVTDVTAACYTLEPVPLPATNTLSRGTFINLNQHVISLPAFP